MVRKRHKKHAGGRPLLMTPAVQERICRNIGLGMTREAAALEAGVSAPVFYAFQAKNQEFQDSVKRADAECQRACFVSIQRASIQDRQWTAAAWILERRWPEEFGRIDRHLIHTTPTDKSALPPTYVDAICKALGMTGEFKPLGGGNGRSNEPIDVEILPQDDMPILPDDGDLPEER
jgi:transposase